MNRIQTEALSILENPFFHRGPIRDQRYFFGRARETRQTLHMLRNGQCVSIVGPRRIGKTSHLFHLLDPMLRKNYHLGEKYLLAYVDCQGLGNLDRPQFYRWILDGIQGALPGLEQTSTWSENLSNFRQFRRAVATIHKEGYQPVLLFDEFEYLATSQYMDQALFSSLRNLSQELGVAYVTVSQMPVHELTYCDDSALHSPFFSNFQTVHLGFLERCEAEILVLGLLETVGQRDYFSEQDMVFLFNIAGRHPFFLQLACYHLFEQRLERGHLAIDDHETARRLYAKDVERFFRYTWEHLGKGEKESVRFMCEGDLARLNSEQMGRLGRKCIVQDGTFFSSVFAEFACRQARAGSGSLVSDTAAPSMRLALQDSEPRGCQLSITCGKQGRLGLQVYGSVSYESDSLRALEPDLVERLNRHVYDVILLPHWRFQVKEIGRDLFEELILNRPEIARGYQRAVGHVGRTGLSLALHAPRNFLGLPFEALHTEDEGYLCLRYPLYRVVRGRFFYKEPLSASLIGQLDSKGERPRALVVASNTWGEPGSPIDTVEEEAGKVGTLLSAHGFDVCLLPTDKATERRVRAELERGDFLLFHYAGHGSYRSDVPEENALYFWEGEMGKSEIGKLTASQLEGLVQDTPLRFVYLSSCWGSHTAHRVALLDQDFLGVMDGLVMGGVPAVLGFRWPVSDGGAQCLAQSFYSAWLDGGKSIDKALLEARRTVADQYGRDERAWFSPILVMQASGRRSSFMQM